MNDKGDTLFPPKDLEAALKPLVKLSSDSNPAGMPNCVQVKNTSFPPNPLPHWATTSESKDYDAAAGWWYDPQSTDVFLFRNDKTSARFFCDQGVLYFAETTTYSITGSVVTTSDYNGDTPYDWNKANKTLTDTSDASIVFEQVSTSAIVCHP